MSTFPKSIVEQAEALMQECNEQGVQIVLAIRKPGKNINVLKVGHNTVEEEETFDCLNAVAKEYDKKWGEGSLRRSCAEHPERALPAAVGFGKIYN